MIEEDAGYKTRAGWKKGDVTGLLCDHMISLNSKGKLYGTAVLVWKKYSFHFLALFSVIFVS